MTVLKQLLRQAFADSCPLLLDDANLLRDSPASTAAALTYSATQVAWLPHS
jgi:hypothetical protein